VQTLFGAKGQVNKEKNEKVIKTKGNEKAVGALNAKDNTQMRGISGKETFKLKGKWQCPNCRKPIVTNPNLGVLAYLERVGVNRVNGSPLVCEHCGATVTLDEAFHGKFKK